MKIEKIKEILEKNQAALIISDANRRYLTGFASSAGIVYISNNTSAFLIDFRYFEKAKREVADFDVILLTNTFAQLNELIKRDNVSSVLVESENIFLSDFNLYSKQLSAKILNDDKLSERLSKLRSIKNNQELEYIKTAQGYAEQTFEYILEKIKPGVTEREIMLDMEFYMRRLGSEGVAFDFIVVSGKNSSLPHGVPTDKVIESGDFITMDFGAKYNGYCSDMTRTVAVGFVTDEQRKVYDTVLTAQIKAKELIKPGAVCKDIDAVSREYIYNSGYEGCFGHGLGHSLGVEVHESPSFNTRCETVLKPGMVMTVEPGIYIENKFGVRIEDMVYITDDGYINLTNSPKELIVL